MEDISYEESHLDSKIEKNNAIFEQTKFKQTLDKSLNEINSIFKKNRQSFPIPEDGIFEGSNNKIETNKINAKNYVDRIYKSIQNAKNLYTVDTGDSTRSFQDAYGYKEETKAEYEERTKKEEERKKRIAERRNNKIQSKLELQELTKQYIDLKSAGKESTPELNAQFENNGYLNRLKSIQEKVNKNATIKKANGELLHKNTDGISTRLKLFGNHDNYMKSLGDKIKKEQIEGNDTTTPAPGTKDAPAFTKTFAQLRKKSQDFKKNFQDYKSMIQDSSFTKKPEFNEKYLQESFNLEISKIRILNGFNDKDNKAYEIMMNKLGMKTPEKSYSMKTGDFDMDKLTADERLELFADMRNKWGNKINDQLSKYAASGASEKEIYNAFKHGMPREKQMKKHISNLSGKTSGGLGWKGKLGMAVGGILMLGGITANLFSGGQKSNAELYNPYPQAQYYS